MKLRYPLFLAIYCCSGAPALAQAGTQASVPTNGLTTELLKYNLRTTIEAYEKVGRKNSKWDDQAKKCLRLFAEIRSTTNHNVNGLIEQLNTNLVAVRGLNCDDPLIRYLYMRFVLFSTESAAHLKVEFEDAASGLGRASYPAIRSFYGRVWVYRMAADTGTEHDVYSLLEQAAPFLAEALKDKTIPTAEATSACEELMSQPYWPNPVRWRIYKTLEPVLTNDFKDSSFALLAKGRAYLTYAWMARGSGYADTVSENGWQLLTERLQIAADALERAWAANPQDPSICLEMMHVELGQGKNRNRLETWFNRGMKLNPSSYNIWYAKLEYLRPRWYGSIPEMVTFGWESMTNSDWADSVRLGLANAHYEASREMPDREQMKAYLQKTNVWSDIRTNFEYFFKLYPQQTGYRHNYARFAQRAGDSAEFIRQAKMFPSTNFAYFGGVDRFYQMVQYAAQRLKEKGPPSADKQK